jgi:hyperosmotically inducible protein
MEVQERNEKHDNKDSFADSGSRDCGLSRASCRIKRIRNRKRKFDETHSQATRHPALLRVFDNLSFKVDGDTVWLYGQAVRPSTRKDAERRVAKIEGVERVINNIEVLPLSRIDDSIRVRTYRAIFRMAGLYRYALGVDPSLHIVVNRGHVTLEGVVANKTDSRLAYLAANQVSGVFSVTNNLRVDREN